MAHLLEIIDGKAQMFSVKRRPWHGMGVILDAPQTSEEAIVAAGLNWEVEKRQAYFVNKNGVNEKIPDQFGVIRTWDETCLGDAGKNWQPLQNKDAFKFFDPFVQSGEASYETAGSLENGKRVWILAKINRAPIEIVKGDVVEKYILLTNYHKAGVAVTGGLTPIRVVCNNTLTGAIMSSRSRLFKANHSSKMNQRLEDIQASIAEADMAFQSAAEAYRTMARKQLSTKLIEEFLANTFQWQQTDNLSKREESFKIKQTETILRLMETGRGADIQGVKGTVWGLYNGITEFVQHEQGKDESRLKNAWFGSGMALNERAYSEALRLCA